IARLVGAPPRGRPVGGRRFQQEATTWARISCLGFERRTPCPAENGGLGRGWPPVTRAPASPAWNQEAGCFHERLIHDVKDRAATRAAQNIIGTFEIRQLQSDSGYHGECQNDLPP